MGDGCIDCGKKREEMIYWSNFRIVQFCQILSGSFDRHLVRVSSSFFSMHVRDLGFFLEKQAIPKKFVKNVRGKLTGKIMLRGPSKSTWDVELVTNGDALLLKHGWKAFVEDHFLEENDILIFKYMGDSRFDVVMFDHRSLCEKEASYFVRRCAHMESGNGTKQRANVAEGHEDTSDYSDDDAEYHQVKTPRTAAERTPKTRRQPSRVTAKRRRGLCEKKTLGFVKKCAHTENESGCNRKRSLFENFDDPNASSDDVAGQVKSPRSDAAKTPASRRQPTQATTKSRRGPKKYKRGSNRSYPLILKSHRREVTAEEIERTGHMAIAAAAALEDSFMVVMRATHVYKRFYLGIPSYWARIHIGVENREVELRFKEKAWKTKYYCLHRGNCITSGLTSGWKEFAIDNALEEYDVCVFDSLGGTLGAIILDVKIFRVVDDVIPPSQ